MGWSLAAAVALIAAGLIVEHRRANPLINVRWLGTREMLRLMAVAAAIRILLSEQAFGSYGLLTTLGMLNDQMVTLNLIIVLAGIAGIATAVLTFRPANVARPITIAAILITIGAFIDADATNLTRPSSFYLSQALIGFASLLFIAQAMVIGIARTLLAGTKHFVSFVVLFSLSQSVGGLVGSALFGTFQVIREKFHSHELVQTILMTDPQVAARVRAGSAAVGGVLGDTVQRGAEGTVLLAQTVSREANILAYNDLFLLIGLLAAAATIWSYGIRLSIWLRGEISPVLELQRRMTGGK
jgi:hypothetical protein